MNQIQFELLLGKIDLINRRVDALTIDQDACQLSSLTPEFLYNTCTNNFNLRVMSCGVQGYTNYILTYIVPGRVRKYKKNQVTYRTQYGTLENVPTIDLVNKILLSTKEKAVNLYKQYRDGDFISHITNTTEDKPDITDVVIDITRMSQIQGCKLDFAHEVATHLIKSL